MDPRDVFLSMPASTVKYRLSLDDLDLALLPMSRLGHKYTPEQLRRSLTGESYRQLVRKSGDQVDKESFGQEAKESDSQLPSESDGQVSKKTYLWEEPQVAQTSDVRLAIESFGRVAGKSDSQVARELHVQLAKEINWQRSRRLNTQPMKELLGQAKESVKYLNQESNAQRATESHGQMEVSVCQQNGESAGHTNDELGGHTDGNSEAVKGMTEGHHERSFTNAANNAAKEDKSTQFCHICNVAVPTKCIGKHNRSKIHKILLQLANEAIGRVNRHIQQQLSEATETSYCSTCNNEIQSLELHEKETQHLLLRKREDLLEKLLDVYTENHGTFNNSPKQVLVTKKHIGNDAATNETKTGETTKTTKKLTNPEEPRKLDVPENEIKESTPDTQTKQTNAVYNEIDSTTNDTAQAKTDKHETSEMKTGFDQLPHGSALVPPKPSQKADAACALPSEPQSETSLVPHQSTQNCEEGSKTVTLTQAAKNAISSGHYFCNICAVKIPYNNSDILKHNKEAAHRAKLEELQVVPSEPAPHSFTSTIVPKLSHSVEAPNSTANATEQDNGSAHRIKLQQFRDGAHQNKPRVGSSVSPHTPALSETSVKPQPLTSFPASSSVSHLKGAISSDHYICKVCNVQVPNNPRNVTEHNKGAAHRAKLLKLKGAGKSNDQESVSPVHSKPVPQKLAHQNESASSTPQQSTNEQQFVSSSLVPNESASHSQMDSIPVAPITKSGANYYCYVCNVKVPNNISNITGHNNGTAHRANLEQLGVQKKPDLAQDVVATTSTKLEDYLKKGLARVNDYCTVCGVNAGLGNFEQHVMSRRHKELFNYGSNITEETVGANFCETCQIEMPNRRTVIHEHYTGQLHKKNFQTYLERNKIVEQDGNKINCIACSSTMHVSFVWGHIRNYEHVEKLKEYKEEPKPKETNPDFCHVCKFIVNRQYMQSHIAGSIHQMRLKKMSK